MYYIFHFLLCFSISIPFFSPFSEEKEGKKKKFKPIDAEGKKNVEKLFLFFI